MVEKNNDKTNLVIGIITLVVIIAGVVGFFVNKSNSSENGQGDDNTVTSEVIENFCQDASLVGKYLDLSKIDIYRVIDQNEKTYENYHGYVDIDGNKIWESNWNGKNKDTGTSIRFNCWVSGKNKDDLKLHYLEIDDVPLYDIRALTVYDNNKELVFAEKTDEERLDALRKCTVMEAADIYTTGIGGHPNTAFEDAKETCERNYKNWSKKDFYDAVYVDWEDRKNETIDGKDLSYYLSILGW